MQQLIPNLPPQSVIVLDNAPYHSIQIDKPLTPYSVKQDMLLWLHKKGVECNEGMRKTELYALIQPLKPKEKIFKIDNIVADYRHTVLRLPPYMCDLNPLELAWSKMKRFIRECNVTADLSLEKLHATTIDAIQNVTAEDWDGFCRHVETLEKQYWEKDGIVPDVRDSIIINLDTDSDSDNEASSDVSSSSSSPRKTSTEHSTSTTKLPDTNSSCDSRTFSCLFSYEVSSLQTVYRLATKFETDGSVLEKKRPHAATVHTPENIEAVRVALTRSPAKSTRRASADLGISCRSLQRILHADLKLFPYKIAVLHKLTANDKERRVVCCLGSCRR
ncbi:hypothetical protein ANN_18725 [Periplaneta americana]|uniref:Tc1-like transposase DDE domain-containing protein n=1 Tax=Periplaneta americana TaxID=6978 RepID=A0ABQ8SQ98_PERAM|nr:hypothetical protein ANN_18725 [Periplaneta americana]